MDAFFRQPLFIIRWCNDCALHISKCGWCVGSLWFFDKERSLYFFVMKPDACVPCKRFTAGVFHSNYSWCSTMKKQIAVSFYSMRYTACDYLSKRVKVNFLLVGKAFSFINFKSTLFFFLKRILEMYHEQQTIDVFFRCVCVCVYFSCLFQNFRYHLTFTAPDLDNGCLPGTPVACIFIRLLCAYAKIKGIGEPGIKSISMPMPVYV